jgi:hypothetical protein
MIAPNYWVFILLGATVFTFSVNHKMITCIYQLIFKAVMIHGLKHLFHANPIRYKQIDITDKYLYKMR